MNWCITEKKAGLLVQNDEEFQDSSNKVFNQDRGSSPESKVLRLGIQEATVLGDFHLLTPGRTGSVLFYILREFILWHMDGGIQKQIR